MKMREIVVDLSTAMIIKKDSDKLKNNEIGK